MRYVFGNYELDDQLYELSYAGSLVELERHLTAPRKAGLK
jgi:hypothetical protein